MGNSAYFIRVAVPETPRFIAVARESLRYFETAFTAQSFRRLSRRSSYFSAALYPPPRFFQNGRRQPSRAMIFHWTATTLLTCCLTPRVHFSPPQHTVTPERGQRSVLSRGYDGIES